MRRYVLVSGAFFCLLAAIQLARVVMGWPVRVAEVTVPVWVSGLAFVIASTFAHTWRWGSITPFGAAVDPLVNCRMASESGSITGAAKSSVEPDS